MNDRAMAFIPWDGELEQLYRDIGQWPGQTPNVELTGAAPHGQQTKPQEIEK
jgi:hypothetical protein